MMMKILPAMGALPLQFTPLAQEPPVLLLGPERGGQGWLSPAWGQLRGIIKGLLSLQHEGVCLAPWTPVIFTGVK